MSDSPDALPDGIPRRSEPPPPADGDSTVTAQARPHELGMVGNFRIIRKLGEGGMGVVYEAEQQNPKRPVALKVIRGGTYVDDNHVRMFKREAQTLARLKHPSIAAIYEAGHTDDGQHFFAMELVRGETLATYMRRKLGEQDPSTSELKERLALIRKLCDAVSYAHQRGVIHRDLKPANVLVLREASANASVSTLAAAPDIKILDFGLARITDSDVAMSTVVTEVGSVQGTLPYMSPEQVRGNPDEIDLRTDVYSLGVLLYELLTGKLPYELPHASLPEAARVICEVPPRPPSKVWSGRRRLDADLQTIVLKALEKEPARRYQSAAALGEDVQRYLTQQPILARPPSAAYQFRKLVARHKVPFAFVAVLFIFLVGFAITMTVQSARIAGERDRANRESESAKSVSEFLVRLFEVSDPSEARGNSVTAREILDKGAEKIERELADQPLMQARLMDTMGRVYMSLTLWDRSLSLFQKALAIRSRELGEDHPDYARSLLNLGDLYVEQGKPAEAQALQARALAIIERSLGPDALEVAWALYSLRGSLMASGQDAAARRALERALQIFEHDPDANSLGIAFCLNDLGLLCMNAGDYAKAAEFYERARAISVKIFGADDPRVFMALNNLGYLLTKLGRFTEAQPYLEQALAAIERSYGPEHPMTSIALQSLGEMWWRAGNPARARPFLVRAVDIQDAHSGLGDMGLSLHTLAVVLRDLHEPAESERMFQRTLATREKALGKIHPDVVTSLEEYAKLLREMHRDAQAGELEARARAISDSLATTTATGTRAL